MFYTLPICHQYFAYSIDSKKISLTNFSSNSTVYNMTRVQKLVLNLTKQTQAFSVGEIIS